MKITAVEYGIEKLLFGKKYTMAYAGITYSEDFVFTRHNKIELCEYVGHKKVSSHWVSKKLLKQLIKSGCIRWISEL